MKQVCWAVAFLVFLLVAYVVGYYALVMQGVAASGDLVPVYRWPVEIEDFHRSWYRHLEAAYEPMHNFDRDVLRQGYWGMR